MWFSEWGYADPPSTGRVLLEGRVFAAASHGQTHVRHQLHGDGACNGGAAYVSAHQGAADQGYITAAAQGEL